MNSQSQSDELNLHGTAKLATGNVVGAIADFEQALFVSAPEKAAAIHYNLGTARHLAGDWRGAMQCFDQAIALRPDFAEAYNNRGMTRKLQGDAAGALADFEQAIRIAPSYAEAYNNRGTARVARKDGAGALDDFTRAVQLDPRNPRAHNNRGVALQASGDLTAALAEFDRAIALNPAYAEAYGNRGLARQEQACRQAPPAARPFTDHPAPPPPRSDLAETNADFNRAIELTPRPAAAPAYHNRGAARHLTGDLAGALADFNQALAIDPGHFPTYANRGTVHKALGDLDAARADLDHAVLSTPRDSSSAAAVYHNRGGVRVLQNDFAGAVADYDIALQIDPGLLVAYLSRGNARYHHRDPSAFEDHLHVLKVAPSVGVRELLQMFGDDLRRDADTLLRNCDKHLRINPADVTALCRRGIARLMLGRDLEQARLDMAQAYALRPDLHLPLAPLIEAASRKTAGTPYC